MSDSSDPESVLEALERARDAFEMLGDGSSKTGLVLIKT